ncbi:hypothetical protein C7H19_01800 [Aphanothece hegewaldii CCALA 016]|uniref:Uncharacterized protein n=1 Tax=Aphanothece hegewaldii CCALA 016 TaxID=2107694 RepID=A0A2T1M400_9CHRO|nr:hypothetical protein [Aphanothece hegewaldii]PSF39548.1 hypothetical protein C7H19_01800 [Aphanothece hegewaldii CCALA 016]
MNSQPTQSDLAHNQSISSSSVEEENTPLTEDTSEEEKTSIRIEIPEPDADNITVLTHKLPNKPILPWNHYDSPWEGSETEAETQDLSEDKPTENTALTEQSSDEMNNQD